VSGHSTIWEVWRRRHTLILQGGALGGDPCSTCGLFIPAGESFSQCRSKDPATPVRLLPRPKRGPDAEGWLKAESRRSRKARLLVERGPRRRVPADLRGRCFNCFSPDHRAAACNNRTRCFKCRRLGHRALWCPIAVMAARPTATSRPPAVDRPRTAIWRRKDDDHSTAGGGDGVGGSAALTPPPARGVLASDPPLAAACSAREDGTEGAGGRRRRRRRVMRRHVTGRVEDGHSPAAGSDHYPVPIPAVDSAGVIRTDAVPRPR